MGITLTIEDCRVQIGELAIDDWLIDDCAIVEWNNQQTAIGRLRIDNHQITNHQITNHRIVNRLVNHPIVNQPIDNRRSTNFQSAICNRQ
jgi:hypothetical protein